MHSIAACVCCSLPCQHFRACDQDALEVGKKTRTSCKFSLQTVSKWYLGQLISFLLLQMCVPQLMAAIVYLHGGVGALIALLTTNYLFIRINHSWSSKVVESSLPLGSCHKLLTSTWQSEFLVLSNPKRERGGLLRAQSMPVPKYICKKSLSSWGWLLACVPAWSWVYPGILCSNTFRTLLFESEKAYC